MPSQGRDVLDTGLESTRTDGDVFRTGFVPIASPEGAEATARAVYRYAHEDSEIIVVHVVEKGEGVPDKLKENGAEIVDWGPDDFNDAIERAVSQRSKVSELTLRGWSGAGCGRS